MLLPRQAGAGVGIAVIADPVYEMQERHLQRGKHDMVHGLQKLLTQGAVAHLCAVKHYTEDELLRTAEHAI